MRYLYELVKAAGGLVLWAMGSPVVTITASVVTLVVATLLQRYGGPGAQVLGDVLQGMGLFGLSVGLIGLPTYLSRRWYLDYLRVVWWPFSELF